MLLPKWPNSKELAAVGVPLPLVLTMPVIKGTLIVCCWDEFNRDASLSLPTHPSGSRAREAGVVSGRAGLGPMDSEIRW